MRRGPLIGLGLIALLMPEPALAHSPIAGIGSFYNGLFHPFLVPAHLLVLLGLGLWIGQQELHQIERALVLFALLLIVGLALSVAARFDPWHAPILLCLALAAGLLVAAGRSVPRLTTAGLAGLAALVLGLDSGAEGDGWPAIVLPLIGTWIGVHLLLLNVVALTSSSHRSWSDLGWRILGSWIAGSALMVLALELKR